eukprot:8150253-Pyramimonas_sp.AAC.1
MERQWSASELLRTTETVPLCDCDCATVTGCGGEPGRLAGARRDCDSGHFGRSDPAAGGVGGGLQALAGHPRAHRRLERLAQRA